jgi:hypothetical protein
VKQYLLTARVQEIELEDGNISVPDLNTWKYERIVAELADSTVLDFYMHDLAYCIKKEFSDG